MEDRSEKAKRIAEKLKRKSRAIRDTGIRKGMLARSLAELDPETMAQVLDEIIRRSGRGAPSYREMLITLGDMEEVINRAGDEKMDEVYGYSRKQGLEEVASMLRKIPPRKSLVDREEEVYMDRDMKDLSLGYKKTLGRTGNRDIVNRLLHDQDPSVIEQILANPALTEEQVVRIAAKRPTNSEILRHIGRSPKWTRSYRVKKALVFNPYTPTEMSIGFLRVLMRQDIRDVYNNESLHFELRHAAKRMLKGEE